MNDLDVKISALSPEKLALLKSRLKKTPSRAAEISAIPRSSGANSFPLSYAQQRLWFLDRLQPNTALYNVPSALHIKSVVYAEAMERALNEIVRRHESLRTTFSLSEGEPVQLIAGKLKLPLPVIDLGEIGESARYLEVQRLAVEEARRPFDLSRGPLLRTTLLRLSEAEYVFLLTMHHIVSDGWSMNVFFRELSILYETYLRGEESKLSELPVQYADFAVWQREYLSGEVLEKELAYWKEQLREAPAILKLPTDRPRPPVQSFRGAMQSFNLPPGVTAGLRELSRQEGVTLFMLLLAAFKVLLYRYTGQKDLVVGAPIANRNRAELEGLIGFFVNTLVLRTDLSGDPSFLEVLRRVREVTLGAYAHQDLPFEKLVEELQPERSLSHNPLFQVIFSLQTAPIDQATQATPVKNSPDTVPENGQANPPQVITGTSKFDLTLIMTEAAHQVTGALEYNSDLFDESTIQRILHHLENLLKGIAADATQRLSALPMLSQAEVRQLVDEWNDTGQVYPDDLCVHELFEQQIRRYPDKAAVSFKNHQLTFSELDQRANQLAHYLRKQGAEAGARIGICTKRSLEMIVGVLGILKAGCAYVPLDPFYPQEQLAFILQDSSIKLLLTLEHLQENLPQHSARMICLDKDWKQIAKERTRQLKTIASPANLAYVLYTSGSTGRPKGVAMTHRPLINLITWQTKDPALSKARRVVQFASLNFDVSFQEIFTTFCSGGTLFLITEKEQQDIQLLLNFIIENEIERVFVPYVVLHYLAEMCSELSLIPTTLREVVTAGEQLRVTKAIVGLFTQLKDFTLHNQYGPTEAHVVTEFVLSGNPAEWPDLSIHRPSHTERQDIFA